MGNTHIVITKVLVSVHNRNIYLPIHLALLVQLLLSDDCW